MELEKKEKKIQVGFKFKESLCKKLDKLKEEEGIPKTSVIEQLLENFFKEREAT